MVVRSSRGTACSLIAATTYDNKFRAYDKATGALLWETTLPFAGNATPSTYMVNGKQYLVIACGGWQERRTERGDLRRVRIAVRRNQTTAQKAMAPLTTTSGRRSRICLIQLLSTDRHAS